MRDLRSKFERGELGEGQMLDGFGYYVDTNPLDGSIRGAALLPVGLAPKRENLILKTHPHFQLELQGLIRGLSELVLREEI